MKCKVCGAKIPVRSYVGLGKYEEVCSIHAIEMARDNIPEMRENYIKERLDILEVENVRRKLWNS